MARETIKIGTKVAYTLSGESEKRIAKVEGIEECEAGEKYGEPVDSVTMRDLRRGDYTFDLSDGHWCYGEQIRYIVEG